MDVDERAVVPGAIFKLPVAHELPAHAIQRAHSHGEIKDELYGHPIVIVSRPSEDSRTAHFLILTSFDERPLEEVLPESKPTLMSLREHYLPVYPTGIHPNAKSKRSRKRFPTLKLVDNAELRKKSYVNIRNVFKMDISLLTPYKDWRYGGEVIHRFERESFIRMLANCKIVTTSYKPGPQYLRPDSKEPISDAEIDEAIADFPEESNPEMTGETSMASGSDWLESTTDASTLNGVKDTAVDKPVEGEARSEMLLLIRDATTRRTLSKP